MRLVFMGTPDFAVPSLEALIASKHNVIGVFTQPDRPAGRGKKLKASPVKTCALTHRLPVYQPERVKNPDAVVLLQALNPDAIVVVAYGQILSPEILQLPSYGCINVHASLLPAYRGAAPIQWAVMHGEKETGITTMLMDKGLDTGDMLCKARLPIPDDATGGEIHDRLALLGARLIIETLTGVEEGKLRPTSQQGESSYAPLLKKEHEKVDWQRRAEEIHNQIRGLNPWPGAYTLRRGEVLKLWRSRTDFTPSPGASARPGGYGAGTIVSVRDEGFVVRTGKGDLLVTEVQPAGKKAMGGKDFALGHHIQPGEILG